MSLIEKDLYEFDEFLLDASGRLLWRNGEIVPLAPKSVETLCLLVTNHGNLITKDEMLNRLWGDTFVEERNLAQNIFTLRKILGETAAGTKFIETIPKRGYRFIAKVNKVQRPSYVPDDTGISHGAAAAKLTAENTWNLVADEGAELIRRGADPASDRAITSSWFRFRWSIASFAALLIGFGALYVFVYKTGTDSSGVRAGSPGLTALDFRRLTDSGKAWHPAISPDMRLMAFVFSDHNKDSIRLQNLATGSVTEVVPMTDAEIGPPVFSRDGNYLYYPARDGGVEATIYRVPIFGGSPQRIVTNVRSDFSMSFDGQWLAFFRYDGRSAETLLTVCRVDGQLERIVSTRKAQNRFIVWGVSPAWSPDGQKLVVAALTESFGDRGVKNREYLVEIDIAGGAERIVASPEWNSLAQPIWQPDGKGLFVIAREAPNTPYQIWQLSYPGGEAQRVTNDLTNYFRIDLAPDGSFLLTNARRTAYNLWIVSSESPGVPRQITSSSAVKNGYFGLMWTPDGSEIVYSLTDGVDVSNIWKIDVENGVANQLTFDDAKLNWFPSVTPDGKSVIFASDRSGNWHIWRMSRDGSDLRQITDGIGESHPQISPDGRWLYYVTSGYVPFTFWKRELDGGDPVNLLENAGGPSHVSPDSQTIAVNFFDPAEKTRFPWKFGLIPADPGHQPEVLNLVSERSIMRWKPDGTAIYFLEPGRNVNNVWQYSLKDKERRQVTNFDDQKIVNMSVSPDGKRIAVSRGSINSEIIKISGF